MSDFEKDLDSARTIVVKQKKELAEIVLDWESKNNYEILDQDLKGFGYISETSKGFWKGLGRILFRKHRSFEAVIMDSNSQIVFEIKRPFFFIWSDLFLYTKEGKFIGSIHRKFHIFSKKYEICNRNEELVARLSSPIWKIWTFPIKDPKGRAAGKISKKWGGLIKEAFTDADTYALDFETYQWSVDNKSLLLAAAVSIDFDYFEENSSSGGILNIFGD